MIQPVVRKSHIFHLACVFVSCACMHEWCGCVYVRGSVAVLAMHHNFSIGESKSTLRFIQFYFCCSIHFGAQFEIHLLSRLRFAVCVRAHAKCRPNLCIKQNAHKVLSIQANTHLATALSFDFWFSKTLVRCRFAFGCARVHYHKKKIISEFVAGPPPQCGSSSKTVGCLESNG